MNFADGGLFDAQPNVNCSKVVFVMPPQIAFYINIDIYFTLINVYLIQTSLIKKKLLKKGRNKNYPPFWTGHFFPVWR